MTDEQINIAIAESLGFYLEGDKWYKDQGVSRTHYASGIKCYTADLNACHEFEVAIHAKGHTYAFELLKIVSNWIKTTRGKCFVWGDQCELDYYNTASATARQRCEAYLRTIGKWIE